MGTGFEAYLPMMKAWSRRAGRQRLIPVPMFPGYLFVHHTMDKHGYIRILNARGVVRILGERWDRLCPIPDAEVASLQRVTTAELPAMPHPYLHEGQRVRIAHGALAGVEGLFVRSRPNRGVLVLSVDLLHQSVAVEVDCTAVVPISAIAPAERRVSSDRRAASLSCA